MVNTDTNDWLRRRGRPSESAEETREARIARVGQAYSVTDTEGAAKLIGLERVDAADDAELGLELEQAILRHPGLGRIPVQGFDGGAGRREPEPRGLSGNEWIRAARDANRARRLTNEADLGDLPTA